MKKLNLLWIAVLAGLSFTACSDDDNKGTLPSNPVLQLGAKTVSLESENASGKVEILSNVAWTALKSGNASWLTVAPESGEASADAVTVRLTAENNPATASRSAVVKFVHNLGNVIDSVVVTQVGQIAEPLRYRDSLALLAFYEATKGYNWKVQWEDFSLPLYQWPGITMDIVDGQMRVTKIEMVDNGLVGSFPDEMRNLTALKELIITFATMNCNIPDFIGELKDLQFLALAGNGHTGTLPESIYSLTKLHTLHLYSNALTGSLSAGIGNWVNMEDLDLAANSFENKIPAEIGNLVKLEGLKIDQNKFTEIPATISQCTQMKSFYVSGNEFNQELGTMFDGMEDLRVLELGENQFYGELPALTKCGQLFDLRFSHNEGLNGTLPEVWAENLPELEIIQAMDCNLQGSIPAAYSKLKKLANIVVPDNDLTGEIPAFLKDYSILALSNNKFTSISEEFLNDCTVGDLSLGGNNLSGDLSKLFLNFNVQKLDISNMPDVTGKLPTDAETEVNDENMYLALTNLNLSGSNFSGELPAALFTSRLQTLNVGNCNFTGTLPEIIGNAASLSTLIVKNNQLTGSVSDHIKAHANWSVWKAAENICPQQNNVTLDNCN